MIAIRTFLSFSLETEIGGCWRGGERGGGTEQRTPVMTDAVRPTTPSRIAVRCAVRADAATVVAMLRASFLYAAGSRLWPTRPATLATQVTFDQGRPTVFTEKTRSRLTWTARLAFAYLGQKSGLTAHHPASFHLS